MNTQYIYNNNKIEYVVLPYRDYLRLTKQPEPAVATEDDDNALIPQEVIELRFLKGMSKFAAWRKYLKISQKELARRAGMTQGAVSQIEKSSSPHRATLAKLAAAMNISLAQLAD
ncbi:MAG: helix-turn-helix domain-containing protein [Victivallaceae bacterium]